MPRILAEFSPKFTIAALLSQSYGSDLSIDISTVTGQLAKALGLTQFEDLNSIGSSRVGNAHPTYKGST
jgi:hypothetical protein